jgi:peptidoglycan/xylan/chitin deacetylase (PgdA/CDA1 family)
MYKSQLWLLPLLLLFLLSSCQSINRSGTDLRIPPALVFFSFDDGPGGHDDTTARLLDVLKKYEIRALFCLLGENAEYYPDLVKRIHDEGHYLVNHGYSEKHAYRMNDVEFTNNLVRGAEAISSALGFEVYPKLYRPHGGFYHSKQEKICVDNGYILVPVTVRVYDAVIAREERDSVVPKVIRKLEKRNGGIILLHDGRDSHSRREKRVAKFPHSSYDRSWIPETVEEIITVLLEKGFILDNPDVLTAIGHFNFSTTE